MQTVAPRIVPVSRAPWARAADSAVHTLAEVAAAPRRWWQGFLAARRRVLEVKALRELSPSTLRDIGLTHELIGEVQQWREQQSTLRDSLYRGQ